MFGDLLFSWIPYSTVSAETPTNNVQSWIDLCPRQTTWDNLDPQLTPTKECTDGRR